LGPPKAHENWKPKKPSEAELNKMLKQTPIWGSKRELGGMGTYFWALGKSLHSEKSRAKHWVKHTFGNIAKTRAVRKGELVRGMVSQGRPDLLRLGLKVLSSDSEVFVS
jgi:hypothetical protein